MPIPPRRRVSELVDIDAIEKKRQQLEARLRPHAKRAQEAFARAERFEAQESLAADDKDRLSDEELDALASEVDADELWLEGIGLDGIIRDIERLDRIVEKAEDEDEEHEAGEAASSRMQEATTNYARALASDDADVLAEARARLYEAYGMGGEHRETASDRRRQRETIDAEKAAKQNTTHRGGGFNPYNL